MELRKQLEVTLEKLNEQTSVENGVTEQSRRINEASKMFDDLVSQGIIDRPSYRLAPTTSVPFKTMGLAKIK